MQLTTVKPIARFSLLVLLLSGCTESPPPSQVEVQASPVPVASPPVAPPVASQPPVTIGDPFVEAADAAQGAIALTQSAVSPEDWKLIAQQWQRAIALLESVPKTDPKSAVAREKLVGYRENFTHARQQSQKRTSEPQSDRKPLPSDIIAVTGPNAAAKAKTAPPEDASKLALAQHLAGIGAKIYGKADCPECQYQRNTFGSAASSLAEVTCDPKTKDAETDPCKKAGISTYPTWQVKGKLYPGVRSLDELAQLSGYKGDRNFNPAPASN